MTSGFRPRLALSLAAVSLAGLLASCAEPAAPPAPRASVPPVTLSPRVIEQAAGYATYMGRSLAISPAFSDGQSIAQSLTTSASYEPQQLVRGAIAYGAVVALQDPTFVAGVRTYVTDPSLRQSVAYSILSDPNYVTSIPGAASAAGSIIAAVGGQGRQLYDQGKVVKQAAYTIQAASWSKADVVDRAGRLQQAKTVSAGPLLSDAAETARLQRAAMGAIPATPATTAQPPYTPMVTRALAVAALAALGQAGDANLEQVMGLMSEPNAGSCLNLAKLNLYQCLAVSRPHYEDVFCLGEHAMTDTGRCLIKTSGAQMPFEANPAIKNVVNRLAPPAKPTRSKAKRRKS